MKALKKEKRLTQARLKELMDYDPKIGKFFRKKSVRTKTIGKEIKYKTPQGYLMCSVDGETYYCHRLAWLYVYGYFPENTLDHVNRDVTDNRIKNLREVSQQCNLRNSKQRPGTVSGVKGVYWNKHSLRWVALIAINRKQYFLGSYRDKSEAVCARLAAEQCIGWAGCDSSSPAYKYVQKMLS